MIKKVKNTVPGNYTINDRNGEEIVETFDEKEFQKTSQKEFRGDKLYNCMLNGKASIVLIIFG